MDKLGDDEGLGSDTLIGGEGADYECILISIFAKLNSYSF